MKPPTLTFDALAAYLDDCLEARLYDQVRGRDGKGDQNGIYLPSRREVSHLTLALEPWPDLERVIEEGKTDAFFIHRPWRLAPAVGMALEEKGLGVLAYHLSFDEHFTLGFNPLLAAALGFEASPQILGFKEGRPLGMLGDYSQPLMIREVLDRLRQTFRGLDHIDVAEEKLPLPAKAVAIVGAMTDVLVREAHARGASLYVTGQLREPAANAVRGTGMVVAAVGHLRSEVWGLHALADQLHNRFGVTTVVVEPP